MDVDKILGSTQMTQDIIDSDRVVQEEFIRAIEKSKLRKGRKDLVTDNEGISDKEVENIFRMIEGFPQEMKEALILSLNFDVRVYCSEYLLENKLTDSMTYFGDVLSTTTWR